MAQDNRLLRRKVRNSVIISTVSISLVLFLLGSMGFLLFNALKLTEGLKESMTVHVMLSDGVERSACDSLKVCLEAVEGVGKVVFVPKEKAAEEFAAEVGSDFVEFLKFNPLPDGFEVSFNAAEAGREAVGDFEKRVSRWPEVDQVVYQKAVVEQIGANINKFNVVLLFVGGTLLVISLILLGNTIRVTIFSRRYLINTMKLVGATKWFILRPFLAQSIRQGICSGAIATVLFGLMLAGLNEGLPEIGVMGQRTEIVFIALGMIAGGVIISLIFTVLAVNKAVKMNSGQMYVY